MTLTKKNSKNKSNRLKADLFEVLVAIGLSKKYKLETNRLFHETEKLIETLSRLEDGKIRIREQEERALLALPYIVREVGDIRFAKNKTPIKVDWVGRSWQRKSSLSDVDLSFNTEGSIGISLKSTRSGKGTQKNIGAGKLRFYLGLDVSREVEEMWKGIRVELKKGGGELAELSSASSTKIKENKYRFPVIQKIGEKFGRRVQILATKKSTILFNKLGIEEKSKFLEFIFGSREKRPLLNVLVEGKKVTTQWNEGFSYFVSNKNIRAVKDKKDNGKGYFIYIENQPVLRIQVNFTNGIGLSAFCERAFLI